MVGSAACNPVLQALLATHWDERFFFSEWDEDLMAKLLAQQELIQRQGQQREVLLLIDDVILGSSAEEQLAHMCMRGRHFRVSVCMCAVSYTSLPKRSRRSLDTLLVFSCPMKGDMQVLTWEYCQNQQMARFAMNSLKDYQCLVLETLEKKQSLFVWRADLIGVTDEGSADPDPTAETSESPDPGLSQSGSAPGTAAGHPEASRQTGTSSSAGHTQSAECGPKSPRCSGAS